MGQPGVPWSLTPCRPRDPRHGFERHTSPQYLLRHISPHYATTLKPNPEKTSWTLNFHHFFDSHFCHFLFWAETCADQFFFFFRVRGRFFDFAGNPLARVSYLQSIGMKARDMKYSRDILCQHQIHVISYWHVTSYLHVTFSEFVNPLYMSYLWDTRDIVVHVIFWHTREILWIQRCWGTCMYQRMTIWQYDSMTVWQYDRMTVWQYDSMTV